MNAQELLPKTHPTILRRLVNELNRHTATGFIVPGNQGGHFHHAKYNRKFNVVMVCRLNSADWQACPNAMDAGIHLPNGDMVTVSRLTPAKLRDSL